MAGRVWGAVATVALWAIAPAVLAQTGGIRVRVVGIDDGAPLPGVTVTLTNAHGFVPPTAALTNEAGQALFPVLRVGSGYAIEARLAGFAGQRRQDLTVRTGATTDVDVVLTRPTEERIEARATAPVVDLNAVGSSKKFTDEFIEDLPQSGRRYQDVLPRAPGVLDPDGDGNPNVHGARTRDFRAEVSGISNVDPLTGYWLSLINLDSIEELDVRTFGAGVEFGRAQGGFARIVQKQGTNRFEGALGMLYRSSKLDGEGAGNFNATSSADFKTVQPSVIVSGPIVRDRLWFRLSHEAIDREDPVNLLGDLAVSTTKQRISADQLTWQVSPRNRLAFQVQNDPLEVDNLGLSSSTPAESTRRLERRGPTYSVAWTAPVSPRLLLDSRVAYQDHENDLVPTTNDYRQRCVNFPEPYLFAPETFPYIRCFNLTANQYSGSHNESSRDQRQRLSVHTQATLFTQAADHSHQFKFGFSVENERYFRTLERGPELTVRVLTNLELCQITNPEPPFNGCFPPSIPDVEATLSVSAPLESSARATSNNWALYVEDQWKPINNLVVTAGLRFDRSEIDARGYEELNPSAEADAFFERLEGGDSVTAIVRDTFTAHEDADGYRHALADATGYDPDKITLSTALRQGQFWNLKRQRDDIAIETNQLAPRLSVAWDPWNDGKTKLSFSVGRYYDKLFLAVPLVEVEPPVTLNSFLASGSPAGSVGSFISRTSRDEIDVEPLTIKVVDRDLQTPYQDEFAFSIERELFTETSLRASYIRRKFRDQLQDIDINHGPGDFGRCKVTVIQQGSPNVFDPFLDFEVEASPGAGQMLVDPVTGDSYEDTDPGDGDGRLDDCGGGLLIARFPFQGDVAIDTPDGQPDAYVLNPGWNEILLLGNFNTSDYRAIVLELSRRLYRNWEMQAAYTWSRAEGQAEDFDLLLGNEASLRVDEQGFLDYDQRHVLQVNTTVVAAAGFRLGGSIRWESGLPYSILTSAPIGFVSPPDYPFLQVSGLRPRLRYPTGQRNDQRNPSFWTVDVRLAKEFSLGRRVMVQLSLEAFNLLNDDTPALDNQVNNLVAGTRRFGRRWQLGARLTF